MNFALSILVSLYVRHLNSKTMRRFIENGYQGVATDFKAYLAP